MAYNPFNVFRRNQKAIFAVVTVIIMFTFVLSSGLGGGADFFDAFPQWLAGKTRKGDVVATVDGTKLYTGELDAIRRQRMTANQFMSLASEVTQEQLTRYIREQQPRMSSEGRQVIDRMLNMDRQMAMFGNNPQLVQQIVQMNVQSLQQLASADKGRPEDKEVANAYLLSMELANRRTAPGGGNEHYFVNLPNQTQRDAIDFMLWEKKAEQLGIRFTTADVKALIQKEFMYRFVSDVAVRDAMNRRGNGQAFSMDACLKAIAAEFRVRAAQTVVIGPVSDRTDRTATAAPLYNTPFEVYQFYRDQCSPTTYQLLSVPAANFADLVVGTPSDEELQTLFKKYESQEPNPAVETPGFKEPRKIKAAWLSAKGDEPFYQQAAKEWLAKSQFAAFVGGGLTANPFEAVAAAPLAVNNNILLENDYDTLTVRQHRTALMYDWGVGSIIPRRLDTSVVRAENLAALAGAAAGAVSSFGLNLGTAVVFETRSMAAERARISTGMPAFLGGVPGPGMFGTMMMGEARSLLAVPKALPLDVVRPQLQNTLAERTARKFMIDDLTRLNTELNNKDGLLKDRTRGDAKKAIADFLAKRNLPTGKSADDESGFRDEWTIGDEPGLAPVKDALEKSQGKNPHGGVAAPVAFGKRFFWVDDFRGGRAATRDTFKSEFYPTAPRDADASPFAKPEPTFLVWRTEDTPAKTVSFPVAKPKVLAAWKRAKAREIALKRAEEIKAAIAKDTAANDVAIRQDLRKFESELLKVTPDPKAKDRVKVFELRGVCPLTPVTDISSGAPPGAVQQFTLAPSTNVPYPTAEMVKALLDERARPLKTAVVLTDAPKDTYYVAVVSDRVMKTEPQFRESVYSEARPAARGMVLGMYQREIGRKAQESIQGLLRREFKYAETPEQKQKLDENQRKGGES